MHMFISKMEYKIAFDNSIGRNALQIRKFKTFRADTLIQRATNLRIYIRTQKYAPIDTARTHTHTFTRTCILTYTHTHIHTYSHILTCMRIHTNNTQILTHTFTHIRTYIYTHTDIYVSCISNYLILSKRIFHRFCLGEKDRTLTILNLKEKFNTLLGIPCPRFPLTLKIMSLSGFPYQNLVCICSPLYFPPSRMNYRWIRHTRESKSGILLIFMLNSLTHDTTPSIERNNRTYDKQMWLKVTLIINAIYWVKL